MSRLLAILTLLAAARSSAAVDLAACETLLSQAAPILAGPACPARVEAMAAIHHVTLELGAPSGDARLRRRWFDRLREKALVASDPEAAYFLQTELGMDPAGAACDALDPKPVARVPYQPGQGTEARLADVARSLDLGETPQLSAGQLKAIATDGQIDAAVSTRALVLLRRMDPASAAPLLWSRLRGAKKRSDVLCWEEQVTRLPVNLVGAVSYDENDLPAAKAAWLRLAAVRPAMPVTQPDRAGWIALLKGPANEVTEAAWDAAPRVFAAADRAELEVIARAAPERVATRAQVALARLR